MTFKDIPSMFDINLNQVNDLTLIKNKIEELTNKQLDNTNTLQSLKLQFNTIEK